MNRIKRNVLLIVTIVGAWSVCFADDADIKYSSTKIDGFLDLGQVKSGTLDNEEELQEWQVLNRTKISLTQQAIVNDKLVLRGALGGLFYYSLPFTEAPHTRTTKFAPVVEEASGNYHWGGVEEPKASLRVGIFYMKYNNDAQNLGEYLYRSGTYPTILRNGGWYFIDAGYLAQGLHFNLNFLEGALTTDFTLFMERDIEPTYDLTPTFLAKYKLGNLLEFQGGISFNHLIPARPSLTTPKNLQSAYYTGLDTLKTLDTNGSVIDLIDPNTNAPATKVRPRLYYSTTAVYSGVEAPQVDPTNGEPTGNGPTEYYTFKGVKMIGRVSFSPFGSFDSDPIGLNDFKLYTEIAVLGWKNHPVLYEKRSNRMPIMFGLKIPTFNLLDQLCFEGEYWDRAWPNDQWLVWDQTLPIPGGLGSLSDRAYEVQRIQDGEAVYDFSDKFRWSFFATRTISKGMSLIGQISKDHMRVMDYNNKMSSQPVTGSKGDWWYLLRLHLAI